MNYLPHRPFPLHTTLDDRAFPTPPSTTLSRRHDPGSVMRRQVGRMQGWQAGSMQGCFQVPTSATYLGGILIHAHAACHPSCGTPNPRSPPTTSTTPLDHPPPAAPRTAAPPIPAAASTRLAASRVQVKSPGVNFPLHVSLAEFDFDAPPLKAKKNPDFSLGDSRPQGEEYVHLVTRQSGMTVVMRV